MEHPPRELVQQLSALGLASSADVRRCAGRVRRLARGLPVTEIVWLDALVLSGKLSPFQARALEFGRSEDLVIGRKFVLQQPMHLDPLLATYSAQLPGRRDQVFVSRMPCPPGEGEAAALRLLKTVKNLSGLRAHFPFLPFDALLERGEVFLLAPLVRGESLSRLLVRRGRFPEAVVRMIAQEILKPLQAAESLGVHGDLRPANLWLTARGDIHLLNWGLLDAVAPELNIHSRLPLDAYDGMAPERIDSPGRAVPTSDVYALGCLFWQLLTGRPPYAVADPLAKVMAHRLRQIPDVRSLAPDVSESLALLIRAMTARDVHRRPQSYQEIRQQLGTASPWTRGRLQRFYQEFESAAPRQSVELRRKSRIPALAGAALLSVGLCVAAWNRDQLGWPELSRVSAEEQETLRLPLKGKGSPQTSPASFIENAAKGNQQETIPSTRASLPTTEALDQGAPIPAGTEEMSPEGKSGVVLPSTGMSVRALQALPSPTLEGIVTLEGSRSYAASPVITGESLVLQGTAAEPATIHIHDMPLVLEADQVRLEHLRLLIAPSSAGSSVPAPLQLRAKTFSVHRCSVVDGRSGSEVPLIHWLAGEAANTEGARLLIQESEIATPAAMLCLDVPLAAARLDNVLVRGAATVLEARQGAGAGLRAPLILKSCTVRECGSVIRLPGAGTLPGSGQVSLQGEGSVIALTRGAPLAAISEPVEASLLSRHLEVNAQELIVEVGTILAGTPATTGPAGFVEIPSDVMRVDGLLSGDFHFEPAGHPNSGRQRVVIDALPVRASSQVPGVDLDHLPTGMPEEVRSLDR